MSLKNHQLGTLSQNRNKPVWSVVLPVSPGASQTRTLVDGASYDDAAKVAFEAYDSRPWLRRGDRVIEIRCEGRFHSWG